MNIFAAEACQDLLLPFIFCVIQYTTLNIAIATHLHNGFPAPLHNDSNNQQNNPKLTKALTVHAHVHMCIHAYLGT